MGPYAIIFQNKTKYCNKNGVNSYCDKLFLVQYLVTANSTVRTFIFSNRKRNKNVRFCYSFPSILKRIGIYLHMAPENHFGCHTPYRQKKEREMIFSRVIAYIFLSIVIFQGYCSRVSWDCEET